MNRITLTGALVLGLALTAPAAAHAASLTFEGLSCQGTFTSYGGFTFSSNWVTECDADYASMWGNTSGAPSAVTAAGNTYAGDPAEGVTITRALPFNLLGGMASSFLIADDFDFVTPMSSASLLIEGYLLGDFVGSTTIVFDPGSGGVGTGYHNIGSLLGVDELRFFSSYDLQMTGGPDYWLVDDLELADVDEEPAAVPEPATLTLLAVGLGAAVLRRRRTHTHATRKS